MRVLILEDDPGVSGFLEEALRKHGHEPTSYGHAGLALGAIARGRFELLLCDVMLPNVNGVDAMRMARSQFPYLPIIAISAQAASEWEQRCLEAGASRFFSKPLRVEELIEELRLVESSQVDLTVGILDQDARHAERVAHELTSLGCDVHAPATLADLLRDDDLASRLNVLLVQAGTGETRDALTWAGAREIPAVAFGDEGSLDEDQLMRQGAAFCLSKPIETEALVTQARFFVAPPPREST